jgi:hypothetical protein
MHVAPQPEGIAKKELVMRSNIALVDLEMRALDEMKAVLGQVSVIKVKEMRREPRAHDRSVEILAHINVCGHDHLLACGVKPSGEPTHLKTTLRDLRNDAASFAENATPVIIAPYLSPEAQRLCKESDAGFLDLEGNARLSVGEIFIGMRSLPRQGASQAAALCARPIRNSAHRTSSRAFPSDHAAVAMSA